MSGKNDGGDKTEKPTPKRLKDARKKGDVAKSKDVTATVTLIAWVLAIALAAHFAGDRFAGLFAMVDQSLTAKAPFVNVASEIGWAAFEVFLILTAAALVPVMVIGVLTELLQSGIIITFDKLSPSLDKMNPVEGFKRMFSMDNLVELAKNVAKVVVLGVITWIVLDGSLRDILSLVSAAPIATGSGAGRAQTQAALVLSQDLAVRLLSWTLGVFLLISIVDAVYQKHSFIKKMKMSVRDIRREHKENEGDPHVKGNRRQLHQEWAQNNAVGAARGAHALVVNPTHIAIALEYDKESCPVPVIAAKGEGPLAQLMREAAQEAGVPIVRHVETARALYLHGQVEDFVPQDLFEAVAEVILWAKKLREDGPRGEVPA